MSSPSPGRWRWWLWCGLVLQSAGIALFIAALLVGERTRPTFLLLYLPRVPFLVLAATGALLAPLTRRRVALLAASQVAVFLAALFPVMGCAVSLPRHAQHPIHLASYNVFFGKEGRPALIDELVAMPADVLVIQAAFGSLGARLRERLPDRVIRQDGELIVVSKFPVLSAEVPPDLAIAGGTAPMFVKYVIDTPDGALHVYNVHAFCPGMPSSTPRRVTTSLNARARSRRSWPRPAASLRRSSSPATPTFPR